MALVYFLISDFLGNKKRGARTHSATCLLCLFKVNSFHPFEACVYGDRLGSQALFHMGHNTDFFFFFYFISRLLSLIFGHGLFLHGS